MGRRPITTLTLSKERAEQLKLIAVARYLSTAQLFARFINSEIRKGTIPDEIPGYRIKRIHRHVEIGIIWNRTPRKRNIAAPHYLTRRARQGQEPPPALRPRLINALEA
jgi:apolipoprotein N-acyltransferase